MAPDLIAQEIEQEELPAEEPRPAEEPLEEKPSDAETPPDEGEAEAGVERRVPVAALRAERKRSQGLRRELEEFRRADEERERAAEAGGGGKVEDLFDTDPTDYDAVIQEAPEKPYRAMVGKLRGTVKQAVDERLSRVELGRLVAHAEQSRELGEYLFPDFKEVMDKSGMNALLREDPAVQRYFAGKHWPAIKAYQVALEMLEEQDAAHPAETRERIKREVTTTLTKVSEGPRLLAGAGRHARGGGGGVRPGKPLTQTEAARLSIEDWDQLPQREKDRLLAGG